MKLKLLFLLIVVPIFSFGQNQVNSFYGADNSNFQLLTSTNALSHGSGGINQTWTFNQLVSLGNSVYTYVAPTTQELTTYPGTTTVIVDASTQSGTTTTSKMFTKNTSNNVSITGIEGTGFTINCVTNNATLGTFPLTYGYTNSDPTAGTFTYNTYSGTFSGTLVTSVDAYGTLNLPDFNYTGTVVRLKTVLSASLSVGILSGVGTATQTTYTYYDPTSTSNNFIFRSSVTTAVASLLGVNQTTTILERYVPVLSVKNNSISNFWVQNPARNNLMITVASPINNAKIVVADMLGKSIFSTNTTIENNLEIPLALEKGMYLVSITDDQGSTSTKKVLWNN